MSFVAALLAAVILALFGQFVRRPIRAFAVVTAAVLALSFVPPFTLPGAAAVMVMALLLMHPVTAATTVFLLATLATHEGRVPQRSSNPARGA